MKKYAFFALTFVLTTALLVGCGCTNQNKGNTTEPTILPTNEEIWDTTESTTRSTTEMTLPTASDAADSGIGNNNGTGSNGGNDSNNTTGGNGSSNSASGNAGNSGANEGTNGNGSANEETSGTTESTEGGMESRARRMIPGSNG